MSKIVRMQGRENGSGGEGVETLKGVNVVMEAISAVNGSVDVEYMVREVNMMKRRKKVIEENVEESDLKRAALKSIEAKIFLFSGLAHSFVGMRKLDMCGDKDADVKVVENLDGDD